MATDGDELGVLLLQATRLKDANTRPAVRAIALVREIVMRRTLAQTKGVFHLPFGESQERRFAGWRQSTIQKSSLDY